MSKKIILSFNWKMNISLRQSRKIILYLKKLDINYNAVSIIIYAPFLHLPKLTSMIIKSPIHVGAQNIYTESKGPYTGEIAAFMLKEINCNYILVGHSARRHYFNENYDDVNKKIKEALKHKMNVMLCVGESKEEKNNSISEMAVVDQLVSALKNIKAYSLEKISITYEPIWTIGTGKTISIEVTQYMYNVIYKTLSRLYNLNIAKNTSILYGGSITQNNIHRFIDHNHMNGVLIGKNSLTIPNITKILQALKIIN